MIDKHDPVSGPAENPSDLEPENDMSDDPKLQNRRDFLVGLGRWSRVVIAGAVLGGGVMVADRPAQAGWLNRRGGGHGGGGWINRRGGFGGGSWINRR